jgi:putative PEP-CTERM system histidine kinase
MSLSLEWVAAGMCLVLGLVMLVSRPSALSSWLFFAGMLLLASDRLLIRLDGMTVSSVDIGAYGHASMLVKSMIPGVWLAFSVVYARGASREFLKRWKWGLIASILIPAALLGVFPEGFARTVDSDIVGTWRFSGAGKVWVGALLTITLGVLINIEQTFRASVGMTRWRIKYLILGLALIFGVELYVLSQMLLFSGHYPGLERLKLVGLPLGCLLIGVGLVRSSFATFDIYPSRTLLQGSFTAILAGVYFVVVGLLARWVERLGGADLFPVQALILLLGFVGIAVLFLSERFRAAVRRIISHHFRRPEHDFRKIWTEFTRRTTSVLDAPTLGKNAAEVIAESFHSLGVTVFGSGLQTQGLQWLASTEKCEATGRAWLDPGCVAGFAQREHPFGLENETGPWAHSLRKACPRKFEHGGDRLVVPLVAADRLVGAIVLADRVNGIPYSHEEVVLLKCIGDQLASALLNCSLVEEISKAKELEAFQTLSTFFVHDLKNAANGLKLMLHNLPTHFDDPEFRSDTIKGMSRMVERINRLVLKLSSLRCELQLAPVPCRVDLLAAEVLDEIRARLAGCQSLRRELSPVPELLLDVESMRSVVTNLVLNAIEALNGEGEIRVGTRLEPNGVLLEVADTGCGMTREFISNRLFRPLHSTKTGGLGIGMFQCWKIIEAHSGAITVESEPGKGTRFIVLLPLSSSTTLNQKRS